jgi:hypothetical protein
MPLSSAVLLRDSSAPMSAFVMDAAVAVCACCTQAGLKPGRKRLANEALADSYGTLDEDGCYLGPKVRLLDPVLSPST